MAEVFDLEKLFNKIHQLEIHTPQGLSGILAKESRYVFNYGEKINENSAISLVMPIRRESYTHDDLMGIFAMNRPEGYLRYIIEERLKRIGAPSDMLLLFLAGSNQIGRLSYSLPGELPPQSGSEKLSELLSSPSKKLFKHLIDQYALGSGISGIQPKTLVPISNDTNTPEEHTALPLNSVIVKAEGSDYPGLARNEFFCMSVARKAGISVPEFWLSDDGLLFIMSRFDRKPDGSALGFEDFAVLTGRSSNQKYEGSYEMIAKAVALYAKENSIHELKNLFARVALSCFLRDGDAHLKNFGMLYEHPGASRALAPAYDIVCTDVYPELDGKMALKLNKSKTFPTNAQLLEYGNRLGLSEQHAKETLERITQAYHETLADFRHDSRYQTDQLLNQLQVAIEQKNPN